MSDDKPDPGDEKMAMKTLGMVKLLMEQGLTDAAKKRLKEVLDKYPNTQAADAARTILTKLK